MLGTGSNSTITRHLKRWREETAKSSVVNLPVTIPETVLVILEQFWTAALNHAEMYYQEAYEQARNAIASAELATTEAVTEREKTLQDNRNLQQRLISAQATVREIQDQLLVEQERRKIAEQTILSAEQRAVAATQAVEHASRDADLRVAEYKDTVNRIREETERRILTVEQRFQCEQQRYENEKSALIKRLDQSRTEQRDALKQHDDDKSRWKAQEFALESKLKSLQSELNTTRLKLRTLDEKLKKRFRMKKSQAVTDFDW